ncbi:MAG: hypothetical protein ABIG10_04120, partial [bacterium]
VQSINGSCPFIDDNGVSLCKDENSNDTLDYATLDYTTDVRKWVRLSGKFNLNYDDDRIRIGIYVADGGQAYFDDVRIEPGLNIKDEQYIHSSCRIYAERDSMSCDYYKDNGLRKKGWSGYCLEFDPRDYSSCLMWYPIDKIEAEAFEEGAALNFGKDIYYCIEAYDQCNENIPVQPEMYCKTFIKVNKEKYWYDRLEEGSNYSIPASILTNRGSGLSVDFGVTSDIKVGGKIEGLEMVSQNISDNSLYGAYNSIDTLGYEKIAAGIQGDKIYSFLPYYGVSYAATGGKNDEYFCRATLDRDGKDRPIEVSEVGGSTASNRQNLGIFDDCYVGIATQWDDCNQSGLNTCCGNYTNRSCSNDNVDWKGCPNIFECKTYLCTETSTDQNQGDACNPEERIRGEKYYTDNELWRYGSQPSTRCKVYAMDGGLKKGYAKDTGSDNDDVGCFFDCFNHIGEYSVADNPNKAADAIERLFTDVEACYQWDGVGEYKESSDGAGITKETRIITSNDGEEIKVPVYTCGSIKNRINPPEEPCPLEGRPDSEPNFCYVNPEVSNVKSDQRLLVGELLVGDMYYKVNKKGWIMIQFNSKVDSQQLPLKKYVVDLGYEISSGNNAKISRNVNMYARPTENDPHIVNHFFDYDKVCINSIINSDINGIYCDISPSVTIEDNWGNPSSTTVIDYPIRIYSK